MAKAKRPDQDTMECPVCDGEGVVAGARYTDAPRPCPECKGAGVIPDEVNG